MAKQRGVVPPAEWPEEYGGAHEPLSEAAWDPEVVIAAQQYGDELERSDEGHKARAGAGGICLAKGAVEHG